jgi:hypothetical protein
MAVRRYGGRRAISRVVGVILGGAVALAARPARCAAATHVFRQRP